MPIVVVPGGAYFWLHSAAGDNARGQSISHSDAVASVAAVGSRDVADLAVPAGIGTPALLPGHPKNDSFSGGASSITVGMTYDNGIWDDGTPPWLASEFIVELQGAAAPDFVVLPTGSPALPFSVHHYVSGDGGQSIILRSSVAGLLTGLERIKIWRATLVPGTPPAPFWTSFIGSHEAV